MRKMDRHMTAQRIVALVFLLAILGTVLAAARSPVAAALARGERVSVIVFGVDAADMSRHTDTLMIGSYNPVENYLSVLSIPRDTRIHLPGYRYKRINEIYGHQLRTTKDPEMASRMVVQGVEHLLSSDEKKVDVPYYMRIDFNGFRKLIDLVGGVWVTIKFPMHYDDNAGNYHFHKEPGRYRMDGDDALKYVRFRGNTGDRGRILRQHEFVRDFLKRLGNPITILRSPEIAALIAASLQSNLSMADALFLAAAGRRLRSENVGFYLLPGRPSGSFWFPKKDMTTALATTVVLGEDLSDLNPTPIITPQESRITIKVWNASGRTGTAYQVTRFLRRKGYDVVEWGTYAAHQAQTRIVDRSGSLANARSVATDLGVESFYSEPNPKALVDVEVVIGENYTGLPTR